MFSWALVWLSEAGGEVVWWAAADDEVVNCLEPHPLIPHVLATSGKCISWLCSLLSVCSFISFSSFGSFVPVCCYVLKVVCAAADDEMVNCLEPHSLMPHMLAT
jgi:hypothetical protein